MYLFITLAKLHLRFFICLIDSNIHVNYQQAKVLYTMLRHTVLEVW